MKKQAIKTKMNASIIKLIKKINIESINISNVFKQFFFTIWLLLLAATLKLLAPSKSITCMEYIHLILKYKINNLNKNKKETS